jgi:UDP-N-acetylglucosamine--dolichyl-phosphate N-acetylglucosaminephosphotransferase
MDLFVLASTLVLSAGSAGLAIAGLLPNLRRAGIVGQDLHKPGRPEIPEMGGLGIAFGFTVGLLWAIAFGTFFELDTPIDQFDLFAILATVLIITLIGVLDDLIALPQGIKVFLPLIASLPLVAVKAGQTFMTIPFLGRVEFGYWYTLVIVPLGVTGAANAVNILAGFNGLEAGMGLVAMISLAVIAAILGAETALVVLIAGIGALIAVLYSNWYPARVLLGDAGTLTIGAILAASSIVGNFEAAGLIVILPYFFDFIIKATHGFPSRGWWGELREGRLHCPTSRPVSLCQWIMKLSGGISERSLVMVLMGIEALFGLLAVLIYRPL